MTNLTDLLAQHRRVAEKHKNCGQRGCRDFVKANDPDVALALNAYVAAAERYVHNLIVESDSSDPDAGDDYYRAQTHLHEVLQAKMKDDPTR